MDSRLIFHLNRHYTARFIIFLHMRQKSGKRPGIRPAAHL